MLNSQTLLSQRVSFLYMIYQSDHISKTPGVKTHRFCTQLEKHASWKKKRWIFRRSILYLPKRSSAEVTVRSQVPMCSYHLLSYLVPKDTNFYSLGKVTCLLQTRDIQFCHLGPFPKPQTIKHNWDNWRQVKCIQLTISPRTPWLPQQTWRSWICFSKIAKKWMRSCLELNFLQKPTS